MKLRHENHSVGQSAYHFVWRPKYNVKVFLHPVTRRIAEDAIRSVAAKWKMNVVELKVMPDHVH